MSPAVFKTDTTAVKVVGWVRFPDAPAICQSARDRFLVVLLTAVTLAFTAAAPGHAPALRAQEREPPPSGQDTLRAEEDAEGGQVVEEGGEGQAEEAGTGDPAAAADQAAPDRERPVSPAGAMLRSVIVPGWGQTAARQPARGAIYFTVWSGGIFMIIKSNSELNAAKRAEDEELVDSRSQAREDWILFTGLWALLSGVDAWVSAQFAGFEGEVRPPQDGSPGVEFSYPVKLF